MKPIKITEELEEKILSDFIQKFQKEWTQFKENMNETKFNFSVQMSQKAKEKITVRYSQSAYLKMQALVENFDTEVGWYGFVKRLDENTYYVYDVKVCKQYVTSGKVDTEDEDTLKFFDSLTDEEIEDMHFQAHSHVNMSTTPSGTDLQNQSDVVRNMGNKGFYLFQIWNKRGDINSFLYNLDENLFYDRNDIVTEIEGLDEFILSVDDLVIEQKTYPYQYSPYPVPVNQKEKTTKKNEEKSPYLNDYWDGCNYNERWDW